MSSFTLRYVSYDRFPAPKGASVHIAAFARALAEEFQSIDLTTVSNVSAVGNSLASGNEILPGVFHTPIHITGKNLIQRVLSFREQLRDTWPKQPVEIAHFRSIFEGYPIARDKSNYARKLVYEVNGLPSIELKYHYPEVADDPELLAKLRHQEQVCLDQADLVLTVSTTNADYLLRRGVKPNKLRVIPNGVDASRFSCRLPERTIDHLRLLYVGTLAPWQGLATALEALALYRRDAPASLTVIGEARKSQVSHLQSHAERLGVHDALTILPPMGQDELRSHYHAADVALAPLQPNDRNLVQGCCPLKVLEAMSTGVPLVASDLPVVRSLVRDGTDAILSRPGSAKSIKDALLRLHQDRSLRRRLAASARRRVKQEFTWQHAQEALIAAYREVLGTKRVISDASACDSRSA